MPEINYASDANVAANTEIDLSAHMDAPAQVRGGADAVRRAVLAKGDGTGTGTIFSSTGTLSSSDDAGSGTIGYIDGYTVKVGDVIEAGDTLTVAYDAEGQNEQPL